MITFFDTKSAASEVTISEKKSPSIMSITTPESTPPHNAATTPSYQTRPENVQDARPSGESLLIGKNLMRNPFPTETLSAPRPPDSTTAPRGKFSTLPIEFRRPWPPKIALKPAEVQAAPPASKLPKIQTCIGGRIPTNGAADRSVPGQEKGESAT